MRQESLVLLGRGASVVAKSILNKLLPLGLMIGFNMRDMLKLFCASVLLVLIGCDQVKYDLKNAKEESSLTPIFDSGCTYMHGTHNLDLACLDCVFDARGNSEIIRDLIANYESNGWQLITCGGNRLVVSRDSTRVEVGVDGMVRVTVRRIALK